VRKKSGSGVLVAAALIIAVAISAVVVVRFGPWKLERKGSTTTPVKAPPSAPAAGPTAQAPAPAQGPAAGQQKPSVVPTTSPAGGGAAVAATPAVKPGPTAPLVKTPASTAAASKPNSGGGMATDMAAGAATVKPSRPAASAAPKKPALAPNVFGIAVGTYLDEGRANTERTNLTESTRLPAQVVTVAEDSVSMYRVVMGSFENRISAERTASDLVRRGLVNEARVVQVARATPPPP
jgi:hypothetical protein